MSRHEQETEIKSSAEHPKHGRLSRLIGRAAMAERPTDSETLEPMLYMLEKDLQNFEKNWEQADAIVHGFADSPQSRELLKAGILEFRTHDLEEDETTNDLPSDNRRRIASRMSDKDLTEFVGAHVLRARLKSWSDHQKMIRSSAINEAQADTSMGQQAKNVIQQRNETARGIDTADLRWREVKAQTCEHMPSLVEFIDGVEKMGKQSRKYYQQAYEDAESVVGKIHKYLGEKEVNERKALDILDLIQNDERQDAVNPSLLKLLGSDFKNSGRRSILGRCVDVIGNAMEDGALVTEFLDKKSSHNNGDNYINFIREVLTELGLSTGSDDYLRSHRDKWPSELSGEYLVFAKSELSRIKNQVDRFATTNYDKRLLLVDADSVAIAMEKLLEKFIGRVDKPYSGGKAKITPKEALRAPASLETKRGKELQGIKVLVPVLNTKRGGQEYEYGNGDRLERMKQDLVERYQNDKKLPEDIENTLETLKRDPFNTRGFMRVGTAGSKVSIKVGGKPVILNRFNPAQYPGLSLGERGKQLRVIYTVAEDNLCVLEMLCDHNEYERALQKYK